MKRVLVLVAVACAAALPAGADHVAECPRAPILAVSTSQPAQFVEGEDYRCTDPGTGAHCDLWIQSGYIADTTCLAIPGDGAPA